MLKFLKNHLLIADSFKTIHSIREKHTIIYIPRGKKSKPALMQIYFKVLKIFSTFCDVIF